MSNDAYQNSIRDKNPVPETFNWNKVNCEFCLDLTENLTENTYKN